MIDISLTEITLIQSAIIKEMTQLKKRMEQYQGVISRNRLKEDSEYYRLLKECKKEYDILGELYGKWNQVNSAFEHNTTYPMRFYHLRD